MIPRLTFIKNRVLFAGKAPACLESYEVAGKRNVYSFPVCGDIIRRLRGVYPTLEFPQGLRDALYLRLEFQRRLEQLLSGEDCEGDSRLEPYQRVGSEWLKRIKKGILADSQGLGKTVISLVAARDIAPRRALIVCSKAKKEEWVEHVQKWVPGVAVGVLSGTPAARRKTLQAWEGYLVCNYTTAKMHQKDLPKATLVILDEAHILRNRKTDFFPAIRKIVRKAGHAFILTASPTVNATGDIWTLLNLCDSHRFSSYWGFIFRFHHISSNGYGLDIGDVKEEEQENLERLVSFYVLFREGKVELPTPRKREIIFELYGVQRELYDRMDTEEEVEYNGKLVRALTGLSLITRLRQLALHPGLIFPDYVGESKFDLLEGLIRERDSKVILFSQYAQLALLASEYLNRCGILCLPFIGSMNSREQKENLAAFQQGNHQVISTTYKSGGEGLNLTEADRVISLEMPWHQVGFEHAFARVLRRGQTSKEVDLTSIYAEGTIEDHIREIVMGKRKVSIREILSRRKEKV